LPETPCASSTPVNAPKKSATQASAQSRCGRVMSIRLLATVFPASALFTSPLTLS